jgi:molecular chaperone HtpG
MVSKNEQALLHSPHLDVLRKLGYNALAFTDPADVMILEQLGSYRDYPLVNIEDADLILPKSEKEPVGVAASIPKKDFASLIAQVQTILCDRVLDVCITDQLSDSPARLVDVPEAVSEGSGGVHPFQKDGAETTKMVLELNPRHLIMVQLDSLPPENPLSSLIIEQIYENARLAASIRTQAK